MNSSELKDTILSIKKNVIEEKYLQAEKGIQQILVVIHQTYFHAKTETEKEKVRMEYREWYDLMTDLHHHQITDRVVNKLHIQKKKSEIHITKNSQGWCADIFELYHQSIVCVQREAGSYLHVGTGFFISKSGYFLTNQHVVEKSKKIQITFANKDKRIDSEVIACDVKNDLALCKVINPKDIDISRTIPLHNDYSSLKQGANVVVIGNGLAMGLAPVEGIIKFIHNGPQNDLVFTAATCHGDSGGPVFNQTGYCIGINKSSLIKLRCDNFVEEIHGIAQATPADIILSDLEKWKKQYHLEF